MTKKVEKKVERMEAVSHEGVTLITQSEEITAKPMLGVLSSKMVGVYEFKQDDAKFFRRDSKRRWFTRSHSKEMGRTTSKNVETGEFRLIYTLTHEQLKTMTRNDIEAYGKDIKNQVEKIVFVS